jgi:hypothetical protein
VVDGTASVHEAYAYFDFSDLFLSLTLPSDGHFSDTFLWLAKGTHSAVGTNQ